MEEKLYCLFLCYNDSMKEKGFDMQNGRKVLTEELAFEILSAIEEIPPGCVATYGQIARLIGRPGNARLVGRVLSMAEFFGSYPCHRVVNSQGRTAFTFTEQRSRLEEEGVRFLENGKVDMKHFRWDG